MNMANRRGSLLISLIIGMTVVAILGAGMIYMTTTATYAELFANRQARAYYLGEAGGRFAMKLLGDNIGNPGFYPGGKSPASTTYTMANNDRFTLTSRDHLTDASRVVVESTGIVHAGAWLESKRKITYNIIRSNPESAIDGTTDIAFDGNQDVTLDTTWKVDVGNPSNISFDSKTNAVLIKNEEEALIALKPTAIDLADARTNSGNLLSYEVQVKVNPVIEGNKGEYFVQGISFRYDQTRGVSYGVSFFRAIYDDKKVPDWYANKMGDGFKIRPLPRDGNIYLVLWKKTSKTGRYELMNYAPASAYGLTYLYQGIIRLRQFSTLLLNLKEECLPAPTPPAVCTSARRNRIQLYVASPDNYPAQTIHWNYTTGTIFQPVTWTMASGIPNNSCSGAGEPPTVCDSDLTTQNYAAPYPSEVGVHSFYDQPSSNDQYFADFAMRGEGLGGSGSHQY